MYYLFLINPFLSVITALRDLRQRNAQNILWLFVIFVGITWALRPDSTVDSVRYVQKLEFLHRTQMSFWDFQNYRGDVDLFSNWLIYVISRFTDWGPALIISQSIIFGFFFSRNMTFVFKKLQGKVKPLGYILFITFFLIVPIWSISGFRFWLATHVFTYGLLHYFFDNKKSYLIWCFITPFLFHYAFLLPMAVLGFYLVVGNRTTIFFVFFAASLFLVEFNLSQFNKILESVLPEQIQERSSGYRSESSLEKKQAEEALGPFGSKRSWHAVLYQKSLFWSISVFLIYFYFRRKKLELLSQHFKSILSFALLFGSFANFLANLPSGQRYSLVLSFFAISFILVYVQNSKFDKLGKRIGTVVAPLLIFYVIVSARQALYYFSVTTILGNPMIALFSIGENLNLDALLRP